MREIREFKMMVEPHHYTMSGPVKARYMYLHKVVKKLGPHNQENLVRSLAKTNHMSPPKSQDRN